jgi:5'-deoxynucleotidase YfbR-like HD superfamily hydrolase
VSQTPNKPRPPPPAELLTLFDLVSSYAGRLNQVERFTLDTETGLPETVALHTLRLSLSTLALLVSSGASWSTIGKAVTFALIHDLPEIKTGDVVTLGGLTPEQRAEKNRREDEAVAEIRAEMIAAAPTSGHLLTNLLDEYAAQHDPAAQLVHLIDKIVPSIEHNKDQGVKLHTKGWTAHEFGSARAAQHGDLRAKLKINSIGSAAQVMDWHYEALLIALDRVFINADVRVLEHLRRHDDAAYERYKAELHTVRPFPPDEGEDLPSQPPGADQP